MRFAVPRSLSPSPVRGSRRPRRRGAAFGLPASSSSSEDDESSSEESTTSFVSSDAPEPSPTLRRSNSRTEAEMRYIEDAVASVRLRTRHTDAYEEWEQETRRDAFHTARRELKQQRDQQREEQAQARADELARVVALQREQAEQVAAQLRALEAQRQAEDAKLREQCRIRNVQLWQRIEAVIKAEEAKVAAQIAEERRKADEVERKKKEELERKLAEERRKAEEAERLRKEEEDRRKAKEKEEEAQRAAKLREEEETRKAEEEERAKTEGQKAEEKERRSLGLTTAIDDWRRGREALLTLKSGPMKTVKGNKELKSVWSAVRRQITPKVGQVTGDAQTINRVSSQILALIQPNPPHPPDVYAASLSSLAKAILLQAETEVTASEKSAAPLAAVAANLLSVLPGLADVLWAKTVQRAGGWPCGCGIPTIDVDGKPFDETGRRKALGYRESEGNAEYGIRVSGIMRVYFEILRASATLPQPLDPLWRLPRVWIWTARMAGSPRLLESPVAPQLIFTDLNVMGVDAKAIWGKQWIKLLALLYEGATAGLGTPDKTMGGSTAEGKSARVRVQLEIERTIAAA